ncbi:MAG: hypothetical protein WA880_05755 [Ornithinimicrobium sp.]
MRTTVDVLPAVHRRAKELAQAQHRLLSAVLADLTMRGLAQIDEPPTFSISPRSGMHVLSVGRVVTSCEIADLLDDE